MKKLAVCILVVTAILGIAACSNTSGLSGETPEYSLENVTWILESYGERGDLKAVLDGTEITATFNSDEGRVTGSAGCNSYFGDYEIDENKLFIPVVGSTEMYCMEPEGNMEQEVQYLKLLNSAESYEFSGSKLRIISGTQVLAFGSATGGLTPKASSIEISCDAFMESNQISLSYAPEIEVGDSVTVTLCSNPTTGFRWSESAEISDQTVLEQVEHTFISPEAENMVGSAGKETWIFKGLEQGMSSISMEYSQPWEDGIKAEWTFNLTVFVQ
ncbi:protease inhibitor I42 family protein [Chloroflexota bacterium]